MAIHVSSGQVSNGVIVSSGRLEVYSGGVATATTVYGGGSIIISSGGVANSTTMNGGDLHVSSGGVANLTTVNSYGYLCVSEGGVANETTVNGGYLCVSSGGTAGRSVVGGPVYFYYHYPACEPSEEYGCCVASGGAVINDTVVYNRGVLMALPTAKVCGTLVTGKEAAIIVSKSEEEAISSAILESTTVKNGAAFYLSGGIAQATTVKNDGQLFVYDGACAESASVSDWGTVYVFNGGSADGVTVGNCGELHVGRGGTATLVRENGGCVEIMNGAVVTFAENSFSGFVVSSGKMTIHTGTVANATRIENGELAVYEGGIANSAAIANGSANFYRGGKVTGALTVAEGAVVSAYEGSIVDFDVSTVAPGSPARINNLSAIQGAPDYTITVSARQSDGIYKLAGGAARFNKTVTVNNRAGAELGTVSVGGALTSGAYTYSLAKSGDTLSLTVEGGVPWIPPDDLNGDGRADIVMTITQAGHGAYGATGAWLIGNTQTAAWGDLSQRNAGWEIFGTGVTTAGKSTNDVYVKSTGNVVGAWITDDDGKVAGWYTVGEFDASTQILGLGDFDGDGQTDLLLRNTNGAVGCFLTDGTGWNYFQSLGDEWKLCAVGDLNGDGRDDVVLKHDAGFAGSWLTQSDGTMAWANLDTLQSGFSIVGAGDFDGDGTDDVLLKNGNYYGAWLVKDGSVKSWMGLGDLGNVTVEQIADFDGDGTDDLRIRTAAGDLGVQLVKGADTLDWKYYGSVGSEWSTSLAAI